MLKGTVKWFDQDEGAGIIESEDGEEVYVMSSSIVEQSPGTLYEGDKVTYNLDAWKRGLIAVRVKVRNHGSSEFNNLIKRNQDEGIEII